MDILIEETRGSVCVAATDKDRLQGLEIDPITEEVRWGSIYWAKVKSIDAALDAVFLDLDGQNMGILYNRDVRVREKDGSLTKGGAIAISKRFKAGSMIAVQAKSSYLPRSDSDFLSRESKIAQMSMDITLPGRYLIYCPLMDSNKISARIRDKELRKILEKMLKALADIHGCILRASAANTQTEILQREGQILQGAWKDMQKHLKGKEPLLIALGPDAVQRSLSDQAGQQIDQIQVVTMEHLTQAEDWCSVFAPDLVTKITPVEMDDAEDDLALFHYRDLMGQIEDLFQPYAVLPSGGNIIIQNTAALTAIDVNKGADKGSLLSINLEAAAEIARQIRLRNIGGIIVIDFLKIQGKREENALLKALEQDVGHDPCTVQIHGKTALGLVELTRKRRTPPLHERFEGGFGN